MGGGWGQFVGVMEAYGGPGRRAGHRSLGTQDTWEVGQAGRVRDLSIGGGVHGGGDVQLPVSSWS